jgi:hypothetical protein
MSSEPKNIMTMAELLRAAKMKKEQEEREQEKGQETTIPASTIPSHTIPDSTIPQPTAPRPTIVPRTIVENTRVKTSKMCASIMPDTIVRGAIVDSSKGYFQFLNDLSDRVIPELKLKPFEQVVLNRLYRLSRGWKSGECMVGLGALAKQCVMSRTSVQKSIGILVEKGLIEDLGEDKKGGKEGKRYRVLPGMTIPPHTIPKGTIVKDEETILSDTTEVRGTIPPTTTNKDSNKDLINTHLNTADGVHVGSKFTIEECRRYAQHLQSTGQGIKNPGGYATTIHRTGEADMLIERFLHPEAIDLASNLDTSQCPDCNGSGFYYPKGIESGVARCKHEQLREEAK